MERDTKLVFVIKIKRGSKRTGSNAFIRGETDRVKSDDQFIVPVFCNNVKCKALRDSGSSICLVRRSIVGDKVDWTGESIKIVDAFERSLCLPLAKVKLRSHYDVRGTLSHIVPVYPSVPRHGTSAHRRGGGRGS